GLPQEAVDFPELILLPLIERVVMTLSTLHLLPEENPRQIRSRFDVILFASLIPLKLREKEVHRTVFFEVPFCCDQIVNDLVPGTVSGEGLTKEFLHPDAAGLLRVVAADEDVGPDFRKIPDIIRVSQQLVDELRPLVRLRIRQKCLNGICCWDVSDNVEID